MQRRLLCIMSILLWCSPFLSLARATWIPLQNPHPSKVSPQFVHHENYFSIYVQLPGFYQVWSPEHQRYQISIPGAGLVLTPATPRVPILSYIVALPCSSIASVRIHYVSTVVFAHVPVVVNDGRDSAYSLDFRGDACLPHEAAKLDCQSELVQVRLQNLGKMQGWEIFNVSICPFYADLNTAELHAAENFKIEISYTPKHSTLRTSRPLASQWRESLDWHPAVADFEEEIPDEYLMVTPAQFVQALDDLVSWRTAEGMLVTVKTLDEIKREMGITGLLSADRLQEYLSLYYNRVPSLTYVLLVGDVEFIPVKYENDEATDLYYSLLDGTGDRMPDVYLGRLPVNSSEELTAVVEKIIASEKMPPSKRVLLASYFQDADLDGISDRDYVYTTELFRSYLIKRQYVCGRVYTKTPGCTPAYYGNYEPVPADIPFDGTTQDIVNFINIGAALVNHRDHGTARGWENPPFHIEDFEKLCNKRYPLMFNVDCETGKFDQETEEDRRETEGAPVTTDSECFSELLLTLRGRGVVAVIAPSRMTTNSMNNTFNRGLMGAIWPPMFESCNSPASRLGQVLYRGRIAVLREFSGNGWVNERVLSNFRCYNLLGDPAMRIQMPQ